MTITSKDVDRELRRVFWPAARDAGFTRRAGRTAWRDRDDQVDVIGVRSFNAYDAGVIGTTTVSFAISLGVFPRCRINQWTPQVDDMLRPKEHACDFRMVLRSRIEQPELPRNDIWFVAADGSNIDDAVWDAGASLLTSGLQWFEELNGLERLLAVAQTFEKDGPEGGTWGIGNPGSPQRLEIIAALSSALGRPVDGSLTPND